MTPAELEALVAEGTAEDVLEAMRDLSEKERRALAPTAVRLAKDYWRAHLRRYVIDVSRPDVEDLRAQARAARERHGAACAALLASGSPSELARHDQVFWKADQASAALTERRPPWLSGLAETLMAKSVRHWDLCYRLVMTGLCQRPTSENWCLGFLSAGGGWVGFHSPVKSPDQHLSDPVFVERELWRLFEIEGTSVLSFMNIDRFSNGRPWATALLAHAAEGKIPRARLLDATLDALQRDFVQYRAGWFADLHRDLGPSVAERVERLDRYLALLASRIPPTVSFALDALVEVERAGELPPEVLLAHIAPAVQARAKKTALAALALAERAAAREPRLSRQTATVAAEGLGHDAADVQARAIAVVIRLGDKSDRAFVELVRDRARATAATLRPRLLDWLGEPTAPARSEPTAAAARTPTAAAEAPLRRARSLDDAIDLLAGAIERFDAADEMEGALDGVARFCGERPPDFALRLKPLTKRAGAILGAEPGPAFDSYDLRGDLCTLALAWSCNREVGAAGSGRFMRTLLAGRIREVAVRAAAARPTTLLATPTHRDGWIDPEVLARRALTAVPDPLDAIQSLLRIARDGRASALALASDVPGEYGAAFRFALGGPRAAQAPESDLWLAAEAARLSDHLLPRFNLLRHHLMINVASDNGKRRRNETLAMRWVVTVFPADLRNYFAVGGAAILCNLEWSQALWWNCVYLEPLLRPDVALERNARRMLAAALASKSAAEGGLATDVLIQAIDDGRAKSDELGESFAALLSAELAGIGVLGRAMIRQDGDLLQALRADKLVWAIKCARWAKRLQDAARASPRHAAFVRDLIERALRGLPTPPPADLGRLLALLRELSVETSTPIRDPEARAKLATVGGGGATARLARALLDDAPAV
jgi:hypothetical protein